MPFIEVRGARVNNLKGINLDLPLGRFIVISGLSGSGKSSLAFDTLYAEGQRRYVESLSAYARQFLGRMKKPECDSLRSLPPAVAIGQYSGSNNPRSTVATSTEIYDYLRLLFARVGHTFSPVSGTEVKRHTPADVARTVRSYSQGTRFMLLVPLRIPEGRTEKEHLALLMAQGLSRLDINGTVVPIEDVLSGQVPPPKKGQEVFVLIDRLSVSPDKEFDDRLADSVQAAFFEGNGECMVRIYPSRVLHRFSTRFEADGITFQEPTPHLFSFNNPLGACPKCEGFGRSIGIDERKVIPNQYVSIFDGAVACWRGEKMGEWRMEFCRRAATTGFPIHKPYVELTPEERDMLWHGLPCDRAKREGAVCLDTFFSLLEKDIYKIQNRVMLARFRGKTICPACHGSRLRPEALYVKVGGRTIADFVRLTVKEAIEAFRTLTLSPYEQEVAGRVLHEITSRLAFLDEVGLGYLTLDRFSNTLSGGESQRIRLATAIGSALEGALYVLDEPSIGLHSRDTLHLISALKRLRDLGNTVVVVEHDEDIIRAADFLVDIGPEAGTGGGKVVYSGAIPAPGSPEAEAAGSSDSYTLRYLLGRETIAVPSSRRRWNRFLEVQGARENNLRNITVRFPLNVLCAVTGVSGSGKTTLVRDILYQGLRRHLNKSYEEIGAFDNIAGDTDALSDVVFVEQNALGRSTRSNPVTYIGAYDIVRDLLAAQPLARQLGITPMDFSFNVAGGRCEECKGEGVVRIEMQFMADIDMECESCGGKRFQAHVLEITWHGKNVYDILELTVDEALQFFTPTTGSKDAHMVGKIHALLQVLSDVGLGYVKLGQNSASLSGGESQRVKLAYYLARETCDPMLFIFDEPTTGLHVHDVRRLLTALDALVKRGHSVVVIEHNLELIKCADYVIDLGPEAADGGGDVVACGTPEEVAASSDSLTAPLLRRALAANQQ